MKYYIILGGHNLTKRIVDKARILINSYYYDDIESAVDEYRLKIYDVDEILKDEKIYRMQLEHFIKEYLIIEKVFGILDLAIFGLIPIILLNLFYHFDNDYLITDLVDVETFGVVKFWGYETKLRDLLSIAKFEFTLVPLEELN